MRKTVAIIHFNTPMLTEAAIKSLRKHGGEKYHVTIFDNSDSSACAEVIAAYILDCVSR